MRVGIGSSLIAVILTASLLAGGTPADSAQPLIAPHVDWSHERPGDGSSPRAATALTGHGTPAFAVAFHERVDVLDQNGELIWSSPGLPSNLLTLGAGDLNGDGVDDVLVATASFSEPALLTALDGTDGETLWTQETGGTQINAISVWHDPQGVGLVLTATMVGLDDGLLEAYDAGDGTPAWASETLGVPTSLLILPTLLPLDGLIAVGTTESIVHTYTALGEPRYDIQLGGAGTIRDLVPVTDPLGPVNLIAVGQEGVHGLGGLDAPQSASLVSLWSYTDQGARFWSGTLSDPDGPLEEPVVYVNGFNGPHVHAVDARTGAASWTSGPAGARTSFPYTSPQSILFAETGDGDGDGDDPLVIAAGAGNRLIAYQAGTGEERWRAPTPGPTDFLVHLGDGPDPRFAFTHFSWLVAAVDGEGALDWYQDYAPYQIGTTADWDGDGTADAVVASSGHAYVIGGSHGQVLFHAHIWPHLSRGVTTNVAATDLTGDGALDVVVTIRTGTIQGFVIAFDGIAGDVLWTAEADWITGGQRGGFILNDVTGDGVDDVVIGSNSGHPSHVIAFSGTDGSELWRYHVQDDVRDLALARTVDGDRIVVLRDHTSCGCFDAPGLVALDATTAEVRWTRDVLNDNARSLQVASQQGEDRIVVIDQDEDGGEDDLRFLFLDPATGTGERSVPLSLLDAHGLDPGLFMLAVDQDGDGDDEVVFNLRESGGRETRSKIAALSGSQDALLWQTPLRDGLANVFAATPERADSSHDLVAHWGDHIVQLDGSDGGVLFEHETAMEPVWFLTTGTRADGDDLVVAPQGTLLQGLRAP